MTASSPSAAPSERLSRLLESLYGSSAAAHLEGELRQRIARHRADCPPRPDQAGFSERDAILIAYADQVRDAGQVPLRSLAAFCRDHLAGLLSGVHLLPFYPWSSDDGFSVKDYFRVAPEYGDWSDIALFRPTFELMFDAVFNHMSAQGEWFQRFLQDDPALRDFFVTVPGSPDLSQVVRPRALPLLTEFNTARGPEKVWTTFSADQVDVNAKNPRVLLALMDALLLYVAEGARFIRLDAIAYLWKEIGTSCIHLPQTHDLIRVMRAVLDLAAPHVQLITETNVPHADNIAYFGNGFDEAQLVYNFALPPLTLHAVLRGDATYLADWATELRPPSDRTTFFNFLASHDGIGLNPARGILPQEEIGFLVASCEAHGGFINYKHNPDGSRSPYEMNIVYFDALNDPHGTTELTVQVDRFVVTQAIMLALAGVPGIYFHSLFGSRNDREAALATGINRRINRQKLERPALESALRDPHSLRSRVFGRYAALLQARRGHPAFHPNAAQQILRVDPRVFAVLRTERDTDRRVLCLHNVTNQTALFPLDRARISIPPAWVDLVAADGSAPEPTPSGTITLRPYQVAWLVPAV